MFENEEQDFYTLIYIDLIGLGLVNNSQGELFGSIFIQRCAAVLRQALYRREGIYRTKQDGEEKYKQRTQTAEPVRHEELYRTYSGGDEFYIVIKGDKIEALFVCRRLLKELKSHRADILAECESEAGALKDFTIGFRASAVELKSHQTSASTIEDVKSSMRHLKCKDLPNWSHEFFIMAVSKADMDDDTQNLKPHIKKALDDMTDIINFQSEK